MLLKTLFLINTLVLFCKLEWTRRRKKSSLSYFYLFLKPYYFSLHLMQKELRGSHPEKTDLRGDQNKGGKVRGFCPREKCNCISALRLLYRSTAWKAHFLKALGHWVFVFLANRSLGMTYSSSKWFFTRHWPPCSWGAGMECRHGSPD